MVAWLSGGVAPTNFPNTESGHRVGPAHTTRQKCGSLLPPLSEPVGLAGPDAGVTLEQAMETGNGWLSAQRQKNPLHLAAAGSRT